MGKNGLGSAGISMLMLNTSAQLLQEHTRKLEVIRHEVILRIAQDFLNEIDEKLKNILESSNDPNKIVYKIYCEFPLKEGLSDKDVFDIYKEMDKCLKDNGFKLVSDTTPNSNVLKIVVLW